MVDSVVDMAERTKSGVLRGSKSYDCDRLIAEP